MSGLAKLGAHRAAPREARVYWAQPVSLSGRRLKAEPFERASERFAYVRWLNRSDAGYWRHTRGIWYVSQWETSTADRDGENHE